MFYEDVFRKLEEEGVRYVVIGGVALVLYGVVRLTIDLDLFVEMSGPNLKRFLMAMKDLGYKPRMPVKAEDFVIPQKRRRWKEEKGMQVFSLYHPSQPTKLIVVLVDEPILYAVVNRQKRVMTARGISIPAPSIDHLKQLKRISGRPQDLTDIEALEAMEDE